MRRIPSWSAGKVEFNGESCTKWRLLTRFKWVTTQGTETCISLHCVAGFAKTIASPLLKSAAQTHTLQAESFKRSDFYKS